MTNHEQVFSKVIEEAEFSSFLGWFWSNIQIVGVTARIDDERNPNTFIQSFELVGVKLALQLLELQRQLNVDDEVFWQFFTSSFFGSRVIQENEQLQDVTNDEVLLLQTALQNYMNMGEDKLSSYTRVKLKQKTSLLE